PIPVLDGGHLAFFLIEALRGRPLSVRVRETAQQVGVFLLVALMVFVVFNDISRIVGG
ncbi:MAG: RIP metalloprotease RseP, partial [Candidatus Dadabacteria bacterium]